jgi:3-isopropylmalate dehydratase small subunit
MANAQLIHILGDNVSTSDIYPDIYMVPPPQVPPPPAQCAFGNNSTLHNKLLLYTSGQSIAIQCGENFGCGSPARLEAVASLLAYNLTIIAKSISNEFLIYCGDILKAKLIHCPTLIAAENDILDIQADFVINQTTTLAYPIVPLLKVIHILGNSVTTNDICPDGYTSTTASAPSPAQSVFGNITDLHNKIINKVPGKGIVVMSGLNFGCGVPRASAVQALVGHLTELNIIAKSAAMMFYTSAGSAGFGIVVCPSFSADVDDEIEIQTNKVLNKTKNLEFTRTYPGVLLLILIHIVKFLYWLYCKITGKKK